MDERELILTYLGDNDCPCPYCRYNLRGIREALCPECGEVLALHPDAICLARAMDRRILTPIRGLYRAAIAGLAIPIVGYLIMTLAIFVQWPGLGQLGVQNVLAFLGLIGHPALLALLIWQRRWYFRLRPRYGYLIALASWYWAMIPLGVFAAVALWTMALPY